MEEDSELIAEVDEEEDVDKEPDQPSEPALCFPVFHFHDRRAFSDNGHLAFIGVLEDGIALLIAGSSSDELGYEFSGLSRGRSNAWDIASGW